MAEPAHAQKGHVLRTAGNVEGSRSARRNEARQISQQKRAAIVESTRIFRGTGLRGEQRGGRVKAGAPRIVAVVALTPDVDEWDVPRALEHNGELLGVRASPGHGTEEALASHRAWCEIDASRFRQTLQFLPVPYGALLPAMDACRCADFVVLVLSATLSIEPGSWGELCLRTLEAQGIPQTLAVVPTLNAVNDASFAKASKKSAHMRDSQGVRKSLLSFVQYFCPDVAKVQVLEEDASRSLLVRTLATTAPKRVAWRDFRSWLVAEDASFEPTECGERGQLRLTGWIRGAPMSANRLMHIPDFGDFAVDRIVHMPPGFVPSELNEKEMATSDETRDEMAPGAVLDVRDEEADELVSENDPDPLANEQTWPTEEEMAEAPAAVAMEDELPPAAPGTTPREIMAQRTTSDGQRRYEAAWIVESDDNDGDDDENMADDDADDGEEDVEDAAEPYIEEDDDENEDPDQDEEDSFDEDAEVRAIKEFREQQRKEREAAKEEEQAVQFPDEIDTPLETPARQRFARYRGMESMYTSEWDPYEDLPEDYARLFQFDDFSKTRKRVESNALMEGVAPGVRVCLVLRNVPAAAAQRALFATGHGEDAGKKRESVPFVVFGLLRHEHKKSVINFTVTRNTEYDAPVRSKDPLVVCLGFRRYTARPVYSQHIRRVGRGGNNVYKFERFLPHGIGAAVGSVYAPVTFGGANVPVVLLRMRAEGKEFGYDDQGVSAEQTPHLVGAGSVLDVAPTRIIAKRIVLSGHPYKLHKKTATIRFMFFNADDVRYFAPVTLRTKYGRTGHIKESLGTHGYFKAHFDGPLSQMDTVLMSLYKRVFPRWSQLFTGSRDNMPLRVPPHSQPEPMS